MIVLTVDSLTKHFGADPVLDNIAFEVRTGQRIGLVGPNGTGKTTLLNILTEQLDADAGQVNWAPRIRFGYVRQQSGFPVERSVWQEAEDALAELLQLADDAERLAKMIAGTHVETERRDLEARFDAIQEELTRRNAYHLDHQIERVLAGVGFSSESFQQPVHELSGGQQNRLLLAKLLLSAPDVLLLDEPSNHLDIEGTTWLEEFLANSRQAIIVVSHDRYFLDRVTNHTFELLHGTIDRYRGNFSAYRQQKRERLEVQRRTYENQQVEIAKLEDFVRRHHHGQKHAQAEDRRKKLERIERVPLPREIEQPPMRFPAASRSGDIVLRVEKVSKSFGERLFKNVSFDVLRGERWGIVGSNGTGKTTLLRCILGKEAIDEGSVVLGTGVVVGYFDQMLATLADDAPAVEAVRPDGKEFNEQQRRDMLARFGIRGDMVFQPIHQFSGGERNRVALARLAASDVNFLVLDEPTNHLDLWARDSLEDALKRFDGTILCVSHDRFFLNQVVDHLVALTPERHFVVVGNFDDYARDKSRYLADAAAHSNSPNEPRSGQKRDRAGASARGDTKPKRKRRFPYRKVAEIEAEIFESESELETLHGQLNSPDVLRDGARIKQIHARIEAVKNELARQYEHWEEASELN